MNKKKVSFVFDKRSLTTLDKTGHKYIEVPTGAGKNNIIIPIQTACECVYPCLTHNGLMLVCQQCGWPARTK